MARIIDKLLGFVRRPKPEPEPVQVGPDWRIVCPVCGKKVASWKTYADGRQKCSDCGLRR